MQSSLSLLENNINNCYSFGKGARFFIIPEKSLFLVKHMFGFLVIKLPSYYFYKYYDNAISFIFITKYYYISFLKHLSYFYDRLCKLFFVKFKVKGLGYKVKKYGTNLLRFYFTMEMYTYFHVPPNFICRSRKNKVLLISPDLSALKSVLAELLLLKKVGGYNKRGVWYSKGLVFLRKRRKI